jgi:hypothetical protein
MNWLATHCGVNFPWLIYQDIVEDRQIRIDDYRKGTYWIEFYSDLYNTILFRKREHFTWREYVAPYLAKDTTFAVWSLRDPMPFLKQTAALPMRQSGLLAKLLNGN